jgi:hypothetical protein
MVRFFWATTKQRGEYMSVDGTWDITVNTPMGAQQSTLVLTSDGSTLNGEVTAPQPGTIYEGTVDGDNVTWKIDITVPMALTVKFEGTVDGDAISGTASAGPFPPSQFAGQRS